MKKKLLGIIDATAYYEDLADLIEHRSLAALPFGGRYRMIDFMLSNMVNSGIRNVAVFPKMQYRSLLDHLDSGKNWDLNRKRDGLFFFPSAMIDTNKNNLGYFRHFAENLDYFYRSTQEYSLITASNAVVNMNFEPMLEEHIESNCDISEVVAGDGTSLEIYLLKTSLLVHLIKTRDETGYTSLKDVVRDIHHSYTTCQYHYEDYAVIIESLPTYYTSSMNLLHPEIWEKVFKKERPIFTKVKDEPPTRYMKGASVKNSMIANGCVIKGLVDSSIVSREVYIGAGSVVKNSIIMHKCQIGDNCILDSVILDKKVKVGSGTMLTGTDSAPYVVRKGTVQGALMKS